MDSNKMIRMANIHKKFGGLEVLKGIDLEVKRGEVLAIIGPSGSGKSTLLRCLNRLETIDCGTIEVEGECLAKEQQGTAEYAEKELSHKILGKMGMVFQQFNLFPHMTVLENVLVGFANRHNPHLFASFLRLPKFYQSEAELKTKALDLLAIFNLDKDADSLAKNLPYGQQRRLEIVRALATEPKILFLDEPAAGMNPQETAELTQLIRQIKEQFKITIMLIEHDMSLVMDVTERIYVLEYGRLIAHGTPEEIKNNKRVIEAYLGGEA